MTEWRVVPGWPAYEVSDAGAIRRCVRARGGFIGDRKPYLATSGYLYIVVRNGDMKRALAVHRLVALAFIGQPPAGRNFCAHGDGDRLNNTARNLRWVNRSENERDKIEHGKSNRGERQGTSRLTRAEVISIREGLKSGVKQAALAAEYGIARPTVSSIAIGKSWGWLG